MGRIFDDRGNRMTPSHSNKDGVRYRYYVSHAVLQRRKQDAGRVARVPATELERIVVEAVRNRLAAAGQMGDELSDREAIEGYVERIIVRPDAIDIELEGEEQDDVRLISLSWKAHALESVKSVLHQPMNSQRLVPKLATPSFLRWPKHARCVGRPGPEAIVPGFRVAPTP